MPKSPFDALDRQINTKLLTLGAGFVGTASNVVPWQTWQYDGLSRTTQATDNNSGIGGTATTVDFYDSLSRLVILVESGPPSTKILVENGPPCKQPPISSYTMCSCKEWLRHVNKPQTVAEVESLRQCIRRRRPYGDEA